MGIFIQMFNYTLCSVKLLVPSAGSATWSMLPITGVDCSVLVIDGSTVPMIDSPTGMAGARSAEK